jgi:hypothetical protein
MNEDFTADPTPVDGQLELTGYRPPRLRITATYDSEGTRRPTSLDIEIHDDATPPTDIIRQVVADVVAVLANPGDSAAPPPVGTGTWASGALTASVRYDTEGKAA